MITAPEQRCPCWMMRATLCRWMRRKLRLRPKRKKPGRDRHQRRFRRFKTVPYNRQEQKKRLDRLAAIWPHRQDQPLATEEFGVWRSGGSGATKTKGFIPTVTRHGGDGPVKHQFRY